MAATSSESLTNQFGGSGRKKTETLGDMLKRLGIDEDEIDDLVFEEENAAPKEAIKWMTLARIHMSNPFSPHTFEKHMRVAWSPAKEIKF